LLIFLFFFSDWLKEINQKESSNFMSAPSSRKRNLTIKWVLAFLILVIIAFLNTFMGLLILGIYFVVALGTLEDWTARTWAFVKGIAALLVAGFLFWFTWFLLTSYSPNQVDIFAPRKSDWQILYSRHLNAEKFNEQDTLSVWSRSNFDLQLFVSKKQAYWDSLKGVANFVKYTETREPEFLQKPKNLKSYLKRKETLNKSYATAELGLNFPGDNYNKSYAYRYLFLRAVDSVKIKSHPDSLLAYNVGLINYKTEKWVARAFSLVLLLIALVFARRQFIQAKREGSMGDYDFVTDGSGDSKISVAVPKHYDLVRIKQDLMKYSVNFDSPVLSLYISSVLLRFKQKQQQRNIHELIESLNLGIKYMETVKKFRQTEIAFTEIETDEEIRKAENDLKLAKIKSEKILVEKRTAKEIRDLDEDEKSRNFSSIKPSTKSEREILLDKLDQEHQLAIRKMTSEMDKMMAAIRICDQIKNERPQDGEQICNDLFRIWHEKGILNTDS
jgi:hypothetical protein